MTRKSIIIQTFSGHRVAVVATLCFFVIGMLSASAFAAGTKGKRKANRATDERIHLVHANELRYDNYGPDPEAQIVKGKVHFTHAGTSLKCDSAYFYQNTNSMRAMGHVVYNDHDTLTLKCDSAWYDGAQQILEARRNVVLTNRERVLHTDNLNFDRLENYAYYFDGGNMHDGKNKLSSDWGKYDMETKQAVFYYDVHLQTPSNRVLTDTLYYDYASQVAHVVGMYTPKGSRHPEPSLVIGSQQTVTTTDGFFDTRTDHAQLYGRSKVVDQQKTIVADTLHFADGEDSEAWGNVVYDDKENKNMLFCGYARYNEKTGAGFAAQSPLVKDYSQGDTLYMHSDTMRIETFNIETDSVWRKVHCYPHMRAYRTDVQALCDSMTFSSLDSCMTMYRDPIVWNGGRQLLGEEIRVYMNDSTVREAHVLGQAFSIELMPDTIHYNQVSSKDMFAYFIDGNVRRVVAVSNVRSIYYPVDDKDSTLIGLNYTETDTMKMYISAERALERIWMPKATGTLYPMTQIPPQQYKLENFAWFEDIRPKNGADVMVWRGKSEGSKMKKIQRHAAPVQKINASNPPQPPKP